MEPFDPYRKWLGIPANEQPANHYRLLGIELFESDPEVIQTSADRQMAFIAKCAQGPHLKYSQKILNELSAARVCLLNAEKRQAYDLALKKKLGTSANEADGEFQFTGSAEPAHPMASRLANRKKSPLPLALIGSISIVVIGIVAWQVTGQSSPKPIAVAKPDASQSKSQVEAAASQAKAPAETTKVETVENKPAPAAQTPAAVVPVTEALVAAAPIPEPMPVAATTENPLAAAVPETPADSVTPAAPDSMPADSDKPEKTASKDKKVAAATTKPKPGASKANSKKTELAEIDLANLSFDPPRLNESPTDTDQSPENQTRLTELSQRASAANKECVAISRESQPQFAEQVAIARGLPKMYEDARASGEAVKLIDSKLAILKGRPRFSNAGDPLNAQEDKLNEERGRYNGIFEKNKNDILAGEARIEELNKSLKILADRMQGRWQELNGCRKQWLEICRPQDKYARTDFEGAQRVISKWLEVDEFWVDGFCWGALCAYDMGEYDEANNLVERAEKLRTDVLRLAKPIPLIEATQGLLMLSPQGKRSKSPEVIKAAMTHVQKDKDWQTHFVAGRASEEIGRLDTKAKAYFERSMNIDSHCQHAAYWLGRLQTTSTDKSVRDIDEGVRLLEGVWRLSGKQSWRISFALVVAYDAAAKAEQATKQWETTLALAPVREHARLKKDRGH